MKKYILEILSIFLLTGLDQWTKYLANSHLRNSDGIELLPGVFRLEYLENRGAAFGILQGQRLILLLMTLFIFLLLLIIFYKIPLQSKYIPIQIVLVLLVSGAIGNMIDRIMRTYVIDFFYFCLIDFPIFNVADCYVVLGVVIAVLLLLFYYKEEDFAFLEKKEQKAEGE